MLVLVSRGEYSYTWISRWPGLSPIGPCFAHWSRPPFLPASGEDVECVLDPSGCLPRTRIVTASLKLGHLRHGVVIPLTRNPPLCLISFIARSWYCRRHSFFCGVHFRESCSCFALCKWLEWWNYFLMIPSLRTDVAMAAQWNFSKQPRLVVRTDR